MTYLFFGLVAGLSSHIPVLRINATWYATLYTIVRQLAVAVPTQISKKDGVTEKICWAFIYVAQD
jgi:hypothetical protein